MLSLRVAGFALLSGLLLASSAKADEPSNRAYGAIGATQKFDGPDPERTNFLYVMPALAMGYRGSFGESTDFRWAGHASAAYGLFGNGDDTGGNAFELGIGADLGAQLGRVLVGARIDAGYGHYRYTNNWAPDRPQLDALWFEPKVLGVFNLTSDGTWALSVATGPRWRWYRGTIVPEPGALAGASRDARGSANGATLDLALELRF